MSKKVRDSQLFRIFTFPTLHSFYHQLAKRPCITVFCSHQLSVHQRSVHTSVLYTLVFLHSECFDDNRIMSSATTASPLQVARGVAEKLNCQMVGGKRRSKAHDQIWNIKYLPR